MTIYTKNLSAPTHEQLERQVQATIQASTDIYLHCTMTRPQFAHEHYLAELTFGQLEDTDPFAN